MPANAKLLEFNMAVGHLARQQWIAQFDRAVRKVSTAFGGPQGDFAAGHALSGVARCCRCAIHPKKALRSTFRQPS
jgi:hypothetical protein